MIAKLLVIIVVFSAEKVAAIGLYGPKTSILELNTTTFAQKISESNLAIVKFYAHWCGHCVHLSKPYILVAHAISGWKPLVITAAVNCADPGNQKLCRSYGIDRYPTFKVFTKHSKPIDFEFTEYSKVDDIKCKLIESFAKDENWPNFEFIGADQFHSVSRLHHEIVIVIDRRKDCLGKMMIMDFMKIRESVPIFRMNLSTAKSLRIVSTDFEERDLPLVVHVLNRNSTQIWPRSHFLNGETARTFYDKFEAGIEDELGRHIHFSPNEQTTVRFTSETLKKSKRVDMMDLESALSYMFKFEVACPKFLTVEMVFATRQWLWILMKYFPGRRPILNQLGFLDIKLMEKKTSGLKGADFSRFAKTTVLEYHKHELYTRYLPPIKWKNCLGSKEFYRGYPCGVWTLFHVLSVQLSKHFEPQSLQVASESNKMFESIRGYMKYFFGCSECVEHFGQGVQKFSGAIHNADDLILALWKTHNRANGFLAGTLTEDPKAPKTQFPNSIDCPRCRSGKDEWVETEVLRFLKSFYTNISYDSLNDDRTVFAELKSQKPIKQSPWIDLNLKQRRLADSLNGFKHSSENHSVFGPCSGGHQMD